MHQTLGCGYQRIVFNLAEFVFFHHIHTGAGRRRIFRIVYVAGYGEAKANEFLLLVAFVGNQERTGKVAFQLVVTVRVEAL